MARSTKVLINNYSISEKTVDTDSHWRTRRSNYKQNDIEMWWYFTKNVDITNTIGSIYYTDIAISFPVVVERIVFACSDCADPWIWSSVHSMNTNGCSIRLFRSTQFSNINASIYFYAYAEI